MVATGTLVVPGTTVVVLVVVVAVGTFGYRQYRSVLYTGTSTAVPILWWLVFDCLQIECNQILKILKILRCSQFV